jgi:hypothetical protein
MPTNQTGMPFAPDFQLITEPKPVPRVELQKIGRPSVPVGSAIVPKTREESWELLFHICNSSIGPLARPSAFRTRLSALLPPLLQSCSRAQ